MCGKEGYRTKQSQHRRLQGTLQITVVKEEANDEMALAVKPKVQEIATKNEEKVETFRWNNWNVNLWLSYCKWHTATMKLNDKLARGQLIWYDGDDNDDGW